MLPFTPYTLENLTHARSNVFPSLKSVEVSIEITVGPHKLICNVHLYFKD